MERFLLCGFLGVLLCLASGQARASGLATTYDSRGLVSLSYNGVSLIDLNAGHGDPFQIWGYTLGGVSGFGGSRQGWNPATQTLTFSGNWGGQVTCQYSTPSGTDNLFLHITITNPSGQTLDGIDLFTLGLQLPQLPANWVSANYPQFHNNLDAPSLIKADYGSGMFVLANSDAQALYLGFSPSGAANHYYLVAGTTNDSRFGFMAKAIPVSRPIPPGGSDSCTFSLRFAASGTDYHTLAGDVLTTFGQTWPTSLQVTDRRPIGELFMTNPTSAPTPDTSPNPRNYKIASNINVQNAGGIAAFQQAALTYADNAVILLKNMNAQGALVWDLEGQQFPQDGGNGTSGCGNTNGAASYIGSPDMLPQLSPEMDGIADAFFKKFTNAGLKCGMTLRPQTVVMAGTATHQDWCQIHNAAAVYATLLAKAQYAHNRWGCTLFYVDSDGGPYDSTAPSIWRQLSQALPDTLFFPENIWPKDSAYTAPFASYTAGYKPLHTPADNRLMWPNAATLTYIGDAPGGQLNIPEFVQAVRGGDILSFRAWFDDQPLNGQVKQIYQQAGVSAPTQVTLSPTSASLTNGQTKTFAATVTNAADTSVTWSLNPQVGSISMINPTTVVYSPPSSITTTQTVVLTATSNADNQKSAAATVTLNPPPPSIVLTKTVSASTAAAGDTLTFTIQYQNTGAGSATTVNLRDAIPAGTALIPSSISAGGVLSGQTITWPIGTVAASASGSVSFQVTVN